MNENKSDGLLHAFITRPHPDAGALGSVLEQPVHSGGS